jgi:hypothetical protein
MGRTFGLVSFAITMVAAMPAWAQQAATFNRVTTVRREVTAGPAQAGQNATRSLTPTVSRQGGSTRLDSTRAQASPSSSAHPNSSWNQEPRRALPPVSTQATTIPHSYYPNLRAGQSINRNVATRGRCTQSRAGFLTSGGEENGGGSQAAVPLEGGSQSLDSCEGYARGRQSRVATGQPTRERWTKPQKSHGKV